MDGVSPGFKARGAFIAMRLTQPAILRQSARHLLTIRHLKLTQSDLMCSDLPGDVLVH